jgi:hypothetical protein
MMRFILDKHKDRINFEQKKDIMRLIIKNNFSKPEDLLQYIIEFSKSVKQLSGIEIEKPTENNLEEQHQNESGKM